MTIRPIIFSAPMVRALLEGRKTQTRRLASSPLAMVQPGDLLFVRENFRLDVAYDKRKPATCPETAAVWFDAGGRVGDGCKGKLRPCIHMPRWASRLTLEVHAKTVEPLQSISEGDILAEGAPLDPDHVDGTQDGSNPHMCLIEGEGSWATQSPRLWYHRLWDALHGPGSWDDNPDVVALTFSVHHHNVDKLPAGAVG